MQSITKFAQDIAQMSDLKINPGRIVSEERTFMKGVVQGLMDLEEGREMSLADIKNRLGLS